MKKTLIVGNWKMNKTFSETELFIEEFQILFKKNNSMINSNCSFALAVPFTNISAFKANKNKLLKISAQDVSQNEKGAFTGDTSILMLKDLNVEYVILGHSERRLYHLESNRLVNIKAKLAIKHGLTPIICVGESLEQYEAGITKEIVKTQIEESLKDLDYSKIVLAYEPIWAIGTGKVATPKIAQEVCGYIRKITSKDLIIQYGGSVNPKNIKELHEQKDIDGFLVGGASLEPADFINLLKLGK